MRKPLDRVAEAYFGGMGYEFGQVTRDRVHWVCEQATGEKVLDVGCSQGIVDVLLGREGKRVFAIDMLGESIGYAKRLLGDEPEVIRELVEFQVANFMSHDFGDERFDVVIFAEVLRSVTEPNRFLKRAISLLREGGKVVVTLPFGVNDFFDHKKTYYVTSVLEMLPDELKIVSYKFLDSYFCFTLEHQVEGVSMFDLFSEAEKIFFEKDKKFIEIKNNNKFQRKMERELALQKEALELEQRHVVSLNAALGESDKEVARLKEHVEELALPREERVNADKLSLASYKKERDLLRDYAALQKKYDALAGSRLGKATLAYWQWRRKGK